MFCTCYQIYVNIDQIKGANALCSVLPQFGVVVETSTRSLSISAGNSAADSKLSTILSHHHPTGILSRNTMEAMGGADESKATYHKV